VYCAIVTFLILKLLDITLGLRVSREDEIEGLDFSLHGETVHG
jgi:Amt family ammonium transporter